MDLVFKLILAYFIGIGVFWIIFRAAIMEWNYKRGLPSWSYDSYHYRDTEGIAASWNIFFSILWFLVISLFVLLLAYRFIGKPGYKKVIAPPIKIIGKIPESIAMFLYRKNILKWVTRL